MSTVSGSTFPKGTQKTTDTVYPDITRPIDYPEWEMKIDSFDSNTHTRCILETSNETDYIQCLALQKKYVAHLRNFYQKIKPDEAKTLAFRFQLHHTIQECEKNLSRFKKDGQSYEQAYKEEMEQHQSFGEKLAKTALKALSFALPPEHYGIDATIEVLKMQHAPSSAQVVERTWTPIDQMPTLAATSALCEYTITRWKLETARLGPETRPEWNKALEKNESVLRTSVKSHYDQKLPAKESFNLIDKDIQQVNASLEWNLAKLQTSNQAPKKTSDHSDFPGHFFELKDQSPKLSRTLALCDSAVRSWRREASSLSDDIRLKFVDKIDEHKTSLFSEVDAHYVANINPSISKILIEDKIMKVSNELNDELLKSHEHERSFSDLPHISLFAEPSLNPNGPMDFIM